MNLLGFAGYGTDAIGLAVACWYGSTKVAEHYRRQWARIEASLAAKPPSPAARPSAPEPAPGLLSGGPVGEAGTKQKPELLAFMALQADQPYATAGFPVSKPVPGPLSIGLADDEVAEPDAEKLLGAKLAPFAEPLFDWATAPLEWLWRRLAFLGWLRLAVAVPFALVLFGVVCVLYGVMLPFAIIGFLFDGGKDFRLRLIVLAFAAGISLQFLSAAGLAARCLDATLVGLRDGRAAAAAERRGRRAAARFPAGAPQVGQGTVLAPRSGRPLLARRIASNSEKLTG